MLGAIIGDIVGSRFEFGAAPERDFEFFTNDCSFTDDTICTVAIADAILNGRTYKDSLLDWCGRYPNPMGGYGNMFVEWLLDKNHEPKNSYGNGAAMRVSSVGWLFTDWEEVVAEAEASAVVSHNHEEGIKGAQCVAEVISWLRNMRFTKPDVEQKVENSMVTSCHLCAIFARLGRKVISMPPVKKQFPWHCAALWTLIILKKPYVWQYFVMAIPTQKRA